jgi:23S rRNA pseudouridine1911/1915/1917 synthase
MNSKVKQRHARGIFGSLAEHEAEVAAAEAHAVAKTQQKPLAAPLAGSRSFSVGEADSGQRIDKFLAAQAAAAGEALSRTRVQALIEEGLVAIDGKPVGDTGTKLREGQTVSITVPEAAPAEPMGETIPLDIVFEDAHLIVIDKPAGLVVHPAAGHETGTLVNALIAHCGDTLSGIGGVKRPGIVHRLDKDTTGLLVVAKTDAAHQGLAELFADHGRTLNLTREYLALVWGALPRVQGTVDAPVGRHQYQRERQAIVHGERGREAITHWQVEESFTVEGERVAMLVRCALETGRTHQIRVHMAHLGHPVMADPVYASGYKTKVSKLPEKARKAHDAMKRQSLHAAVLGFTHPVTGEELMFKSKLPADMAKLVKALRG